MQIHFDQSVKNDMRTYDLIPKSTAAQDDDYTSGCLLDFLCFKEHYNLIAINLSKQEALNPHQKAVQQINFTGNLDQAANTTMFFIIEEVNKNILDFSQGTVRVL